MNIYYITGTSRGLGHALAEEILKNDDNHVIGIGRKCEIVHPNYRHKILDLSDTVESSKFRFGEHVKAQRVVLINNAGALGEIKYLGGLNNKSIISTLNVNLVSPTILTNNFMKAYHDQHGVEKIVLNISSGASINAYDGWSTYCTSKAGINMLSETLKAEAEIKNIENLSVFSIAPGIIETTMQDQIRESDKDDFSMVDKFVDLKNDNNLQDANETALRLLDLINTKGANDPVFQDLRNQ